jgi:hypothetical protein
MKLLTKRTPAAGVMRPIIDSCDNVPHVGDRQRWGPVAAPRSCATARPRAFARERPNTAASLRFALTVSGPKPCLRIVDYPIVGFGV